MHKALHPMGLRRDRDVSSFILTSKEVVSMILICDIQSHGSNLYHCFKALWGASEQ